MSHNKIKIGSTTPDSSSNINIDLNDLSDVSITGLNVNQMLKYNGSEFENGSTSFESDLKFGYVCDTSGWGSGGYQYSVGDYLSLRDFQSFVVKDTGFNENNSTNSNTPQSNSRWFESIDIPTAGKYLFQISLGSSNQAKVVWRMRNNAGYFGAKVYVTKDDKYGTILCGIADCVENDIFRTVLLEETGSLTLFDHPDIRGVSVQIYKIG